MLGFSSMALRSISFAGCALLLLAAPALAQQPRAAPAKPAAQPPAAAPAPDSGITTSTFGDWALRCQRMSDSAKDSRYCEVSMTIQQKDQPGPIAKIAFGRAAPDQPLRAMILLPTNVSFPSSVKIFADDKDAWGLDFAWVRCIQGGCFAEAVPSDDDLRRWRGQEASGRMVFKDAAGREIAIPVSFRGLGQSLDALMK